MKGQPITYKIRIRIDGELHDYESFTQEEKNEIGAKLNRQGMEALGFKAIETDGTV